MNTSHSFVIYLLDDLITLIIMKVYKVGYEKCSTSFLAERCIASSARALKAYSEVRNVNSPGGVALESHVGIHHFVNKVIHTVQRRVKLDNIADKALCLELLCQ